MKITLATGRIVSIGVLSQRLTYDGVLAGRLDERTNESIVEDLRAEGMRLMNGVTPQLFEPQGGMSGRLPAVACIAELRSNALDRAGSEPYSSMVIAWFQGEFGAPLPTVVDDIRRIDWETKAFDWCW